MAKRSYKTRFIGKNELELIAAGFGIVPAARAVKLNRLRWCMPLGERVMMNAILRYHKFLGRAL